MAQFPSTTAADGIWTLKKVRRAILGDNWPEVITDPNFANVSLLINADDLANGSTAFVDESDNNHTLSALGDGVQVDTSIFKYGTGSIKMNGSADYITAPNSSEFAFGTGDFTVEAWIYPTSDVGYNTVFTTRKTGVSAGAAVWFGLDSDTYYPSFYGDGILISSIAVTPNTWSHVALVRNSGTLSIYVDGVGSASQSLTGDITADAASIGYTPSQSNFSFAGYIDDLRITKGVARYTANFTPPEAALPIVGE